MLRSIAVRVLPKNVRKQRAQRLVTFEFDFNLPKECLCDRTRVRKNPHRDLGVVQDVLDRQAKGDQRTLSVLTGPQIEIAVRRRLHFATAREIPIAVEIGSPEHMSEQKEQIGLRELSLDAAHALCATGPRRPRSTAPDYAPTQSSPSGSCPALRQIRQSRRRQRPAA